MTVQVFNTPPSDFIPRLEVSASYCEYQGRILLLKRQMNKAEGLKWGVPAGKIEQGETPLEAAKRELFEEAGIQAQHLKSIGCLYIRRPELDFVFHLFFLHLSQFPILNVAQEEHTEACWASLQEARQLPLVSGGEKALEYFYLWRHSKI
jgi:8-oxo-dGTP diphosphatase